VALAALAAAAIALALRLTLPAIPLNLYDVSFSLIWGRQLLDGTLPTLQIFGASTPHPAAMLEGALAALTGDSALATMRVIVFAAIGGLIVTMVQLGRSMGSVTVGIIAVLTVALSLPMFSSTVGLATASDLPAVALTFAALASAARCPRRGTEPLVLLAVAGLFRPEPWLLSVAYWAYLAPRASGAERVRLGLIAVAGPVLWSAADWILSGSPFYSLTYTQQAPAITGTPTGIGHAPTALWDLLTQNLSAPVLLGALAGFVLNLRTRRMPVLLAPALAVSVIAFAALGAASLPLNPRYGLPILCLTVLFFGYFLAGWWQLPSGWRRQLWALAAACAVAPWLLQTPATARQIGRERHYLSRETAAEDALTDLVAPASVRSLVAGCGPLSANWRIVPALALDLQRDPRTLTVVDQGIPASGVLVKANAGISSNFFQDTVVGAYGLEQAGFQLVAQNPYFSLYARCAPGTVAASTATLLADETAVDGQGEPGAAAVASGAAPDAPRPSAVTVQR
jgi:hypothetical protein